MRTIEERDAEFKKLKERQEYERLHAVELSIARLRKESAEKLEEASRLERLWQEFPDLLNHVNRWHTVRYYSKSVNPRVDKFDLCHSCGCCPDCPLELWPYLETANGKVYSDPPKFTVGEKHWICGDHPYKKWKEELEKAGIPESIIQAVSNHFKEDAQKRLEAAESSNEDIEED